LSLLVKHLKALDHLIQINLEALMFLLRSKKHFLRLVFLFNHLFLLFPEICLFANYDLIENYFSLVIIFYCQQIQYFYFVLVFYIGWFILYISFIKKLRFFKIDLGCFRRHHELLNFLTLKFDLYCAFHFNLIH